MSIIHKAKRDNNPNTLIRKAPQTEYIRYLIGKYWFWALVLGIVGYYVYGWLT